MPSPWAEKISRNGPNPCLEVGTGLSSPGGSGAGTGTRHRRSPRFTQHGSRSCPASSPWLRACHPHHCHQAQLTDRAQQGLQDPAQCWL